MLGSTGCQCLACTRFLSSKHIAASSNYLPSWATASSWCCCCLRWCLRRRARTMQVQRLKGWCNQPTLCTATLHSMHQARCCTCKCRPTCPTDPGLDQASACVQPLHCGRACTHHHWHSRSSCTDQSMFPNRIPCRKTETGNRSNAQNAAHLLERPSSCRQWCG